MGGLKRGAIVIGAIVLATLCVVYVARGFGMSLTQRTFCATVNRFVINAGGDDIVSLVDQGESEALGYDIRNVIHPPFYWSTGAERRRERLVVGETYEFTSVGVRLRFPRALPTIIREQSGGGCPDPDATEL